MYAAPLFEEERYTSGFGQAKDAFDPRFQHWTSAVAAFTAYNHPTNITEIEVPEVLKERLDRQETDGSRGST